MRILDSRRLTGRSLWDARPGALATVAFAAGEDVPARLTAWRSALERGLTHLRWSGDIHVRTRVEPDGERLADLMLTAERDRLYAATDLVEWAIACANGDEGELQGIERSAAEEQRVRARAMAAIDAARARSIPWLLDDERLTLGHGCRGRTWPLVDVPAADDVDWTALGRIRLALVTGTNGKTTTSRLLARMAHEAGFRVGNTTTDGIGLDLRTIVPGDWTGPGAARELLRRPEVEIAILEVARGGLLRRGLELDAVDAALVTNVERDHLGDYGIHSLADMARTKGLVTGVVRPEGRIVLGADSPALVAWARAQTFAAPVHWFSVDHHSEVLAAHARAGGVVWAVHDGRLVRRERGEETTLASVDELPIAFGGLARHNVANALAAAAVAEGLGLPRTAVIAALRGFGRSPDDNPGRAGLRPLPGGVDLLVDFAHNLAGLHAMAELVGALHRPTILSFGMAGDRSDHDLRALGAALTRFAPRAVVLREQEEYLRGRAHGEVPRLLGEGLQAAGFPADAIHFAPDERSSLEHARSQAREGDLIVLLVHTQRESVRAWVSELGAD